MSTIKYVLGNQRFVSAVITARCDETYSAHLATETLANQSLSLTRETDTGFFL